MTRARRLILLDTADEPLQSHGQLLMIDLDGVHNANSQIPIRAIVQEECDLGHWHVRAGEIVLPCWNSD